MIKGICKTLNRTLLAPALALASLCVLTSASSTHAGELFMFGKKKIFLSPEIHGRLLNRGEPVPATEITRLLAYEDDHIDTAITDANGNFYFPEVTTTSSLPNRLFDETRVTQSIIIDNSNGNDYDDENHIFLWGHQRGRITRVDVTDGRLSKIVFDLSIPYTGYHFIDSETGVRYYIAGSFNQEGYIEKVTLD
jgi:hypothetical protein